MDIYLYEKEYSVPVYEIGADGRINPHSLFNYFQDVASEHAVKLGFGKDDLARDNHFWVLSRISASIETWPGWEDKIIVRTWPRGAEKLFALRDYEILYPDGSKIASATSSWLIVDITTRRVQRPDAIVARFNSSGEVRSALGRNSVKIDEPVSAGDTGASFRVKPSELDVNLHTNNAMYVKWVCDSYDLDFRMNHLPFSFEINFLAESKWDDEITVRSMTDNNSGDIHNHSVVRSVDNNELCRMRIGWKDCRV